MYAWINFWERLNLKAIIISISDLKNIPDNFFKLNRNLYYLVVAIVFRKRLRYHDLVLNILLISISGILFEFAFIILLVLLEFYYYCLN